MGMSIIQELTPYLRGYEYFPGSGQATNAASAVRDFPSVVSAYRPRAAPSLTLPPLQPYINLYILCRLSVL